MLDFINQIESIKSKDEFVKFVKKLREDLENNKDEWENLTLEKYLEAIESFVDDSSDEKFINNNSKWSIAAKILYGGKIYE